MKLAIYAVSALSVLALTAPISAGELSNVNGKIEWTVTGCAKPEAPVLDNSDAEALNRSVNRYAGYVEQINAYTECLTREAEQDMRRIYDIILKKMREAQQEAIRDADDVRVKLFTRTE